MAARKQKVREGDLFYIPMGASVEEVNQEFVVATAKGYLEVLTGKYKMSHYRNSLAKFMEVLYLGNIRDSFIIHKPNIREHMPSITEEFDTKIDLDSDPPF